MSTTNYCVIMAGGIGSRFWPLSREEMPKQFLDILGTGETLIQQTYRRFRGFIDADKFLILTNNRYKDIVLEQLPELGEEQILCEPVRRNTAPCIAYAAHRINKFDPDSCFVVAPSDHLITNESEFETTIKKALQHAREDECLITLGIKPHRPDTGYGYIEYDPNAGEVSKVIRFTEKPRPAVAKSFIAAGTYLWNSGMFIWSTKSILNSFEQHLPDINALFRGGINKYGTAEESAFIDEHFGEAEDISIDYGIMEKEEKVKVIPSDFGWSDLGTWTSVHEQQAEDRSQNIILQGKPVIHNTEASIIRTMDDKEVIIDGLSGYIVIQTERSLLICPLEREQKIKSYVAELKNSMSSSSF